MPKDQSLDAYLDEVWRIRGLPGTRETSYYPAIANLLNRIGRELKPRVYCLHHPSGGDGIPDFGLFEQTLFRRGESPEWRAGIMPDRGVVEAKGADYRIQALLDSDQVRRRYLPAYGLVLATNLWQYRLIDEAGRVRERFDLADDEAEFWRLARGARPNGLSARFTDFLQRCLLARAPLARPADVAFFLASYAREALSRLEERASLPALAALRRGMEQALGIAFETRNGEHLFRSTLVQTLFYGIFSAWVVHARTGAVLFDWRAAQWSMTVPVARFLFQQAATPDALEPLGLVPLLDAAAETLGRVDRPAFFAAFDDAEAVQYFYEPFLEYFDPVLRRQLGVWYTPREIVLYMVERIDRVLRSELGRTQGLADPDVWVLDPCCGTGSYVVEVLRRIRRTLEEQGLGDLAAERLKRASLTRVAGFEIMTAPFIIAHWQVGEELRRAGAPLARGERAAIYLTNALTGWNPAEETGSLETAFETLARERAAASDMKQNQPILVILGNPPYNAFAGTSPASEGGLVEPYTEGLHERWWVRKFNLDDLYVRFFRVAERRIAERTGQGIVCFISNYSWLSYNSFVVMRKSLVGNFDRAWIENMHGDRTITEYGPDDRSSETIFAVSGFSLGIQQGVAITLLARTGKETTRYLFRDDINASKAADRRHQLIESLDDPDFESRYSLLQPSMANRFLLRPAEASRAYEAWAALDELSRAADWSGVLEKRRGTLMDHDWKRLCERIQQYCDPAIPFTELRARGIGPVLDAAMFDAARARLALIDAGGITAGRFSRIALYPFDERWCFHTNVQPIWNRSRPEVAAQQKTGNSFLVTRARARRPDEGFPCFVTSSLPGDHLLDPNAHPLPFVLHVAGDAGGGLGLGAMVVANLSPAAAEWCAALGLPVTAETSRLVWEHVLAVAYSPAWLEQNADAIRQGWPRVPLPASADLLRSSAALGARIAVLLDPHTSVPGVTTGTPRPELAAIAVPVTVPGKSRDWCLTAGWGARSENGVTMPGRGRLASRPYAPNERATEAAGALLGSKTCDVWMNDSSYWRNIPEQVWSLKIGGYQVIKKWFSYREYGIIERALTEDEVSHVQEISRRLAAILLLGPELDDNYLACATAHRPLRNSAAANREPGSLQDRDQPRT
jgi:hypothetical protein